jgi:hypothetical protein
MVGRLMNGEVERIRKEEVMAELYHPRVCLEGLRKMTKHLRIVGVPTK